MTGGKPKGGSKLKQQQQQQQQHQLEGWGASFSVDGWETYYGIDVEPVWAYLIPCMAEQILMMEEYVNVPRSEEAGEEKEEGEGTIVKQQETEQQDAEQRDMEAVVFLPSATAISKKHE